VGIFVTNTMKSIFSVTGQNGRQIGMKFRKKNFNRCALLNLKRRILKIFRSGGDVGAISKSPFWGCFEMSPCDRPTCQGLCFYSARNTRVASAVL